MSQSKEKFRKDYQPPSFSVDQVTLVFDIGEEDTVVRATMAMKRAMQAPAETPLVLDGEQLELLQVRIDGRRLGPDTFQVGRDCLIIPQVGETFVLEIETRIYPKKNTALSGLYASGDLLCTQCEAEGFRRITYYLDRPDVLARYTTTIRADQKTYPVLLSNGNLVDSGALDDGRHFATWTDPYPKPSYLFALVAGELSVLTDGFVTQSGRRVLLEIYADAADIDKCHHAMASLKQAMAWDERVFGLEYDLDRYMIVAVPDFNMGAMENKGLNIFNTSAVLASEKTATDTDYRRVRGVIGHEYFHNWTGNRVTCRDWFQLSLKEGLTVFRDQQFTSDLDSRTVKRIEDVQLIRGHQFREDAGPMAHPVRPESYIEMNNFYTVTVYYKGAEVIRMMHTLLGQDGFRKGMDETFARHDGQAVTCEDFVSAMEDANAVDLAQFRRWYSQAGTPHVSFTDEFDAQTGTYVLHATQSCPATPGQGRDAKVGINEHEHNQAFHIPIKMGLLDPSGQPIDLVVDGNDGPQTERVLDLKESTESFTFHGVKAKPVPSLFRDFSAPVRYTADYSLDDLCLLLAHDPNEFNRWDAGQTLFKESVFSFVADFAGDKEPVCSDRIMAALVQCLTGSSLDPALVAQLLTIPSLATLSLDMEPLDLDALHRARQLLLSHIAQALLPHAEAVYADLSVRLSTGFRADQAGLRALKNRCLAILTRDGRNTDTAWSQFQSADNMTDQLAALICLSHDPTPQREAALADFHRQWRHEALVLNKWFAIQAMSRHPQTLEHVIALSKSDDFILTNPNRARALILAFTQNLPFFHDRSGTGYGFVAEKVKHLDELNPQVAAQIVRAFIDWQRFDAQRQKLIREQLQDMLECPGLSKDVFEIASKSLN